MHIRRKFFSILAILAMTVVALLGDLFPQNSLIESESAKKDEKNILSIWYTDEYLDEYIRNAAVVYEEKTGVKVVSTRVFGLEFLEAIQKATIDDGYGPDLFIIGNESLEKAYLSGLCYELGDSHRVLNSTYFPEISLDAISYSDSKLGYPLLFECSLFLYNRTLLEQVAAGIGGSSSASDYGEGSESVDTPDSEENTLAVEYTADDILPTSIVGIIEFALNYNLPEGTESYFKWCVSDVLYEYWFAGAYMNVGGEKGDDRDIIDVYNENSMYCLKVFQDFKQFFSMEIDESKYDDILNEFMSGKLLFMAADTNVIGKLEAARKNEENPFEYEYGITSIGMLNDTLRSQGLSVTKLVSVNGMSKHKQEAEDFAKFLTVDYSSNLYARTGKMACNYQKEYQYPQMEDIVRTYENSVSLPKIVETSNYWVLAEMVYTKAWDGEDVNKLLRQLSGQLKKQIHGVYVEDGYIETPVINEDYVFQE
ncbi:MAG: extracellular solute-binding protein [Lachnospiraceae bacterium]|nr:extracellular solute-binding protein [Lachnospiraceae bacterium]